MQTPAFLRQVWRRMLGRRFLNVDPRDSRLLATEAPFGPLVLQEAANEVLVLTRPHHMLEWYYVVLCAQDMCAGAESLCVSH